MTQAVASADTGFAEAPTPELPTVPHAQRSRDEAHPMTQRPPWTPLGMRTGSPALQIVGRMREAESPVSAGAGRMTVT